MRFEMIWLDFILISFPSREKTKLDTQLEKTK